jgi:hypothetical protein
MFVTKKAIPRRTVLRGLGTMLALPLLDGMVPALTALAATPAAPRRRLGVIYVAHGAVMENWTPKTEGARFALSPILEPLTPFQDRLLVLTGLFNRPALQPPDEPGGVHGRTGGTFLTGVRVKPTQGRDFRAGISIDQIAAAHLRDQTQLGSLELTLEPTDLAGVCDPLFSCAYINTLCWRGPTTPLPMENDPRAVFERMFGDSGSTDPRVQRHRMRMDASILDSVMDKVGQVQQRIGPRDRAKLAEYLDAIRDIERRIQMSEAQSGRELPVLDQPVGIPASFDEYAKLMFDLQVLAYQTDLTRVITFMISRELSGRPYPEIGLPEPHHSMSHHQEEPEKLAKLTKLQTYYSRLLAYYLAKLQATRDGDGSLLDQLVLLYGSGMSNSNTHDPSHLPILVAGGGLEQKAGRHIRCPEDTALTNLYVSVLHKVGVPVERIGDSTGALLI